MLTCLNGGKCFVWFLNQKIMFSPYFSVEAYICNSLESDGSYVLTHIIYKHVRRVLFA